MKCYRKVLGDCPYFTLILQSLYYVCQFPLASWKEYLFSFLVLSLHGKDDLEIIIIFEFVISFPAYITSNLLNQIPILDLFLTTFFLLDIPQLLTSKPELIFKELWTSALPSPLPF
jgi:hypothetical protein